MIRLTTMAALAACLLFGGCASIVGGQNQSVSVTAKKDDADVLGAKCSLVNDKGTWYATTPGSVTVRRSYGELTVNCAADGASPGIAMVKSTTKAMAFGNIIFGGLIGATIDVSTGAAYDYPTVITVLMGKTTSPTDTAPGTVASPPAATPNSTSPQPLSTAAVNETRKPGERTAGTSGAMSGAGPAPGTPGCNPMHPACRP